jgi:GNAT superfamily N-acetyltransferase
MLKFKEKNKLIRKEKRFLSKLKSSKKYLYILSVFILYLSPVKRFIVFSPRWVKSIFWIISFSIYKIFGAKIGYIDDFIVNKKARGKWLWTKLFSSSLDKLKDNNCDHAVLLSDKNRKVSHKLYKKFGFTIISLWVGILAYKKI